MKNLGIFGFSLWDVFKKLVLRGRLNVLLRIQQFEYEY